MIYLDNASTSENTFSFENKFFNANSPHKLGKIASETLESSRNRIKEILGVSSGEVIFGGTTSMLIESLVNYTGILFDNLYLADYYSEYEHDCVSENSWEVIDFNNSDFEEGNVYAHIHTNNITGSLYDVDCYGRKIREAGGYFIVDTTATWGHTQIPEHIEEWCDCVFGSAHKFHGPEGTGFMWLSDRFVQFLQLKLQGKKNEFSLWVGTPAITNVYNMVKAFEIVNNNLIDNQEKWKKLVNILLGLLKENSIDCYIVDYNKPKTFAINALTLFGFDSDALVQYLSSKEIYIAPGHSACAENDDYHVLEACGLSKEEAKSTVRISFSYLTTEDDIKELAKEIVNFKNKFM